jgi:hypothetical protein
MRTVIRVVLVSLALAGTIPVATDAHFSLVEPASWLMENQLGDPQKAAPCGSSTATAGTPTGVVGKAIGGSKLHIKVMETVYHPGHYRIALAVNSREELPPDPQAETRESDRGPWSIRASVQDPVKPPVLADGLWEHHARPTGPWETDIVLPNISCAKCTLQIIQFMEEHALNREGDYSYHHCADLSITADPKKPLDKGWPTPARATK